VKDNVKLLEGIYQGLAKGDPGPLMKAMHPQISWNLAEHLPFASGELVGAEAVGGGFLAPLQETFGTTFQILPERIIGNGDTVVMQGRYKGVVQATGRELDVQTAHVWDIRDGKIVKFQQYTDTYAYEKLLD
jgi:ketosteroid isomerase-like protein